MLSSTPRKPRPAPGGPTGGGIGGLAPNPRLENVVRDDADDVVLGSPSLMWKEAGKDDSKNCSSNSSARTTMRKVGNVRCRGCAGSSAAFAASDLAFETLRREAASWLSAVLRELSDERLGFLAFVGVPVGDSGPKRSSSSSSSSSSSPIANASLESSSSGFAKAVSLCPLAGSAYSKHRLIKALTLPRNLSLVDIPGGKLACDSCPLAESLSRTLEVPGLNVPSRPRRDRNNKASEIRRIPSRSTLPSLSSSYNSKKYVIVPIMSRFPLICARPVTTF